MYKLTNHPKFWISLMAGLLISGLFLTAVIRGQTGQGKQGRGREDHPGEAAEFARFKRLPPNATEIPIERYLNARDQMRQMPQYSTALDQFMPSRAASGPQLEQQALGTWTPLGPGNIGGRTRVILINPSSPAVMYAAGVSGGVWKTTNSGGTWVPLADLIANIAVNSMAMDPKNPEIIYAGTGEGYFNVDAVRGAGIFKTTDGGVNWLHLSGTVNPDFHYVNDLVISPNDSQRLYAATETGVWRSVNGGANWVRVLNPLNASGQTVTGGCLDLVIRTDRTTDYLFAACGSFQQATIYRHTDAGGAGAWQAVHTESGMGRTSLALSPSNQNIVYAASMSLGPGSYTLGLHAVFRSESSGDPGTWTARVRGGDNDSLNSALFSNPFLFSCFRPLFIIFSNQGWFDNVIAVDPADSNRVWVGGIGIFRSDDGGANWGLAGDDSLQTDPHYIHVDHHAIVFHPQYDGITNKVMFAGNDGGIYRTDDARAAVNQNLNAPCSQLASDVVRWTALNNSYSVTQFYHGLPYPDGTTYFGGTQDNGTLRGADAAGINGWQGILGGDGGYVAIHPTSPSVLYAENTGLSLQKSIDGGTTWNRVTTGITESSSNFLFIAPYLMDANNSDRLWIGGRTMWRTTNGGTGWTQASATLAGSSTSSVSAIAIAPTNSNLVLAGTEEGFIHRTTSGLTSTASTVWPDVRPRSGFVSWLAFDPKDPNTAYATYASFKASTSDSHVYRTTNGGVTWTGMDGSGATGIPDIPVHCIVVDPDNTSRLYVGTDLGVFVSLDGGQTWAVENTGFANVVTESLSLLKAGGSKQLFAFTHGRGAWRVPIVDEPGPVNTLSGAVSYCASSTPKPVPGVTLTAAGSPAVSSVTNSGGSYSLTGLGVGAYTLTPTKSGEVNGISAFDASLVGQHVAGLITLSDCQQVAGDASGNGALSAFDASLIAQTVAGLPNAGSAGTWKFIPGSRSYAALSGTLTEQNFDAVLVGDVSGNWSPAAGSTGQAAISLAATQVAAPQAGIVRLAVAEPSGARGANVTIPISVSDLSRRGVTAYDFELWFDPAALQPLTPAIESGGTLSRNLTLIVNQTQPGRLRVSAFGLRPLSGGGNLLNLRFRVISASKAATALSRLEFRFNEGAPGNSVELRVRTRVARPVAVTQRRFRTRAY